MGYKLCIASKVSRLHGRKQHCMNYLLIQNEIRVWMKSFLLDIFCSVDNTACSLTGRPFYSTSVKGGWIQQICERGKKTIFLTWITWVEDERNFSVQRSGCCEEWINFHSQSCLIPFSRHPPGRQHCVCRAQLCWAKGEFPSQQGPTQPFKSCLEGCTQLLERSAQAATANVQGGKGNGPIGTILQSRLTQRILG